MGAVMTTLPFTTRETDKEHNGYAGAFAGPVIDEEPEITQTLLTSITLDQTEPNTNGTLTVTEEREPSTFEDGGWRPWRDGRDSLGRSFTEWVAACNDIELGKEPRPPADPRFRGLFPPGPRKPPIAEQPDAKRMALANGNPVFRLDTYARKPSRRTRAEKARKLGASYLRTKDIIVLEWITTWGSLTRNQLAAFLGVKPNTLVRRLGKLTNMSLLIRSRNLQGLATYSVTRAGRRLIGAESWTTPSDSLLRYDHTQACIEVAEWISRTNPSSVVVSEREVQHAGFDPDGRIGRDGDLGPRLKRQAPWLADQVGGDFSLWCPSVRDVVGATKGRKRPDLLMATQSKPTIVVEVELHEKKLPDYTNMIRAYAEAQSEGYLGTVVYLVSDAAPLSSKRLKVLLDRAIRAAQLPPSMKVDIKIQNIPESVWVPLAARLRS